MSKKGGNPQNFKNPVQTFSSKVTGVRLPFDMHEYVESLPNRTEWLREAIAEKIERDRQLKGADSRHSAC